MRPARYVPARMPAPTPDTIQLSDTAVAQYQAEAKPMLGVDAARAELDALMAHGVVQTDSPTWASNPHERPYFLVIADTYALPLAARARGRNGVPWLATACIVKGSLRPIDRDYRKARAADKKSRSRAARRARYGR